MTKIVIDETLRYVLKRSTIQETCLGTQTISDNRVIANYANQRVKVSRYPDWKERIARRQPTTNPYQRSGYKMNIVDGSVSWRQANACGTKNITLRGWANGQGNLSPPATLAIPTNYSAALNDARAKFASSVKQAQTHISGPTFIGELGKSLAMIRRPAKALDNLINSYLNRCSSLRRRYRNKVRRDVLNRDLYDIWLEYSFGWAPLISETKKGAEALSRLINGDRPTAQVRGFSTVKTGIITSIGDAIIASLRYPQEYRDETEVSCSLRGAVTAKAQGPTFRSMDLFGFRAEEFVPTIWELLPMSWVTDYFTNVGDILSATFTDFTSLYWVSQSLKQRSSRQFWCGPVVKLPSASATFSGEGQLGSWILTRQIFARSKPETLVPNLVFTLPGNPNQVVNLSAVLLKSKGISANLSGLLKK